MGLGKFIKDGGLFGLASGYDSDEHGGKPYSFNDLYEDSEKAVRISENLGHTVQNGKKLAVDNSNFFGGLIMEDEELKETGKTLAKGAAGAAAGALIAGIPGAAIGAVIGLFSSVLLDGQKKD